MQGKCSARKEETILTPVDSIAMSNSRTYSKLTASTNWRILDSQSSRRFPVTIHLRSQRVWSAVSPECTVRTTALEIIVHTDATNQLPLNSRSIIIGWVWLTRRLISGHSVAPFHLLQPGLCLAVKQTNNSGHSERKLQPSANVYQAILVK